MKHTLSRTILAVILLLSFGCVDEIEYDTGEVTLDEGELTECNVRVEVADYSLDMSTRAAEPDDSADNTASEQEKAIDNIWVFEYDITGNILIKPRYYTQESKDGDNWLVLLKEAEDATIYIVANTNDSSWASKLADFDTLEELKAQTLPNPDPIEVTAGATDFFIPMAGCLENQTLTENNDITVEVERMFAKLIISAKMLNSMSLNSIEVNNIPLTCRVEARSCADDDDNAEAVAGDYPTASSSWTLLTYDMTGTEAVAAGETTSSGQTIMKPESDIILYIPENIQGEVAEDVVNKLTGVGVPTRALAVRYNLTITISKKSDDDVETSSTQSTVAVYPGDNTTNNFNIKRNRIYKITGTFPTIDYFVPTPSANCFIVAPNSSIVFWPYYRTETGGGYDIRTYLDPTVSSLTIASVKIIWQDDGVIGDNSNYDLVTMSNLTEADVPSTEDSYEYLKEHFKIRVHTAKEGNALIGAYNADGEIIWSWHIWVTDNDPGNVGKAIRYTTYEWDESGIKCNTSDPYSATRVAGYQVMPCNLGAKEFEPTASDKTVTSGPLYQWGRKDPFPSMKRTGRTSGFADYNNKSEKETGSKAVCGSNIKVYDNSNSLITMTGTGYIDETSTEVFRTVSCLSTSSAADDDQKRADGLKYSINHPTTFIAAANVAFDANSNGYNSVINMKDNDYNIPDNYDNNGDWLLGHDNKLWGGLEPDLSQKHRRVVNRYTYNWGKPVPSDISPWQWDNYGDEKTIFDPSPLGWRVPPSDLWLGLTVDGECVHQARNNYNSYFLPKVNTLDSSSEVDANYGYYVYLDGWKSGSRTFFPCPGSRLASGQPLNLNFCGNYHCASAAPTVINGAIVYNDRVNCLHVHAQTNSALKNINQINIFEYQRLFILKAVAGPIRCVRDRM